jgi:hypothetical protein
LGSFKPTTTWNVGCLLRVLLGFPARPSEACIRRQGLGAALRGFGLQASGW